MSFYAAVMLLVAAGCTPGGFGVYVLNPNRRPIAEARATLYDGLDSDVCQGGAIASGFTNAEGLATGEARWCGDARLVVTAHGYQTVTRELNTCDSNGDIHVELKDRPFDPPDNDEMIRTARVFIARAAAQPISSEETHWADSNDPTPRGGLFIGARPCDLYFTRSQLGEEPTADFEFQCVEGCRSYWRVFMVLRDDSWLVSNIAPIAADGSIR